MEMKGLQPVMAEDGVEEVGEGRNQAGDNGVHEEGLEGAPLSLWLGGASPELGLPPLVALPRRQQVRGGKALLRDVGRIKSWFIPSLRRGGLDLARCHWSQMQSKVGADLEVSAARSEKGGLEKGEGEQ